MAGRLDLSENQLSGNLPDELGKLSDLCKSLVICEDVLYLSRDDSSQPNEYHYLTGDLQLAYNQFTGNIPSGVCEVEYLNIAYQNVTGPGLTGCESRSDGPCFLGPGIGLLSDCTCHPTCQTCGYYINPTSEFDCLTCADGLELDPWYDDGSGPCE